MLRKTVVILALLLSSMATQVFALGLGAVTVESALNQPLRVRIEILQLGTTRLQDVTVQMASVADFERFNIDRVSFLSNVQFTVAASDAGNYVTLSSNQIVREPYLSFILDTRWPNGRLLSEHTILLDLPVFDEQQRATPVRQPISPVLRPPTTPQSQSQPQPPAQTPAVTTDAATTAAPETSAATPQPATSVNAGPAAAQPATVTTTTSDTLSDIALQVRPNDSVSIQQTMLAIQRLNPDAFIAGNINRLRAGEVLRVPSLSAIQEVDTRQAASEITRQNQDFANTDVQPLAAPPSQTADQDETPQGQLSVVTSDGAIDASAGGDATAQSSAEDQQLDQRIAELENQLAVQQEEADRARIEREDLDARLDELEQQISAAQEIIRLQDVQLAQLQDSLAQAAAEQAELDAQAAAMAAAEQPVTPITRRSGGIMRMITSNILFIGIGLVLIILLLVALLLRRNRARVEEADLDELDDDEFASHEIGQDDDGQEFQDYDAEDLDSELDEIIGVDADSDPATQATALLANGQHTRAITMLQEALEESPDDQALRMKLLEAHAAEGDLSAFEEQADIIGDDPEFIAQVNSLRRSIQVSDAQVQPEPAASDNKRDSDEADRLGAASFLDDLGIDLDAFDDDDDEPSVTERTEKPEPPAAATKKPATPSLDDDSFHADDMDLTFDLIDDDAAHSAPRDSAADTLDDLELPEEDDSEVTASDTTSESNDAVLEFDITDLPDSGAASAEKETDELDIEEFEFKVDETPEAPAETKEEPEIELETFAFDTDDLELDKSPEAEPATSSDDDENSLDFDFDKTEIQPEADAAADTSAPDLETFEFEADADVTSIAVGDADDDDDDFLDLDAIDDEVTVIETATDSEVEFDLDDDDDDITTTATDSVQTDSTDDFEDLDFLSDDDESDLDSVDDSGGSDAVLADAEEVATKLELAYAYRKMGDVEGAKEILQEVLKEGTPDQMKEASDLMSSLDAD